MDIVYYVAQQGVITEKFSSKSELDGTYEFSGKLGLSIADIDEKAQLNGVTGVIINRTKECFHLSIVKTLELEIGDDISGEQILQ